MFAVVYIYNGILFGLNKEGNSDTCNNKNEAEVMLTEISQSQMEEHCTIPLIGEKSNSERKSKTVVTKGLEKRRLGNYCLMGRIQFGKMEKF